MDSINLWKEIGNNSLKNSIKINNLFAQSNECISPWPSCLTLSKAFFTIAFTLTIMLVSIFFKLY